MLYILGAIFLWSSLGVVIRLSGVPVHLLILFSCVVSFSISGLLLLRSDKKGFPKGRVLFLLLLLGPVTLANTFAFYYALKNTTIANAVLTHYTAPIVVAFLAPIILKEKATVAVLAAVATATFGLWVMLDVSPGQFVDLMVAGDRNTGGIMAGLFSGFAYAAIVIILRILAQAVRPLVVLLFQNGSAVLLLLPFAGIPENVMSALWAFVIMGVVHSTIAPLLYYRGMKDTTANNAVILGYLEPVCAIIFGVIFLNESVTWKTIFGGAMILFSGYLTAADSVKQSN